MLQVTLASLRTSTRRYTATALAIVLGVGFVAATLVLSATLGASVRARISDDLGRYAVVVTTSPDGPTSSIPLTALTTLAHLGGVASAEGTTRSYARVQGAAQELTSAVTWHDLRTGSPFRLVAGRGPTTPGQVAVSTSIATRAGLTVAGPVSVSGPDGTTHVLVVSGIVDTSRSGQYGSGGVVFGTAPLLATWSGSTGLDEIDVVGAPGTSDTQLRDAVSAAMPDVTVRTGGEEADAQVTAALKDTQTLTLFLLAFAVVALFVSTLVIANTFAILVAQRLQQLALVRCVGATRRQVFGSVLLESLAIGVIGSA
ncbi:MAG: ABC transporter permease, partial [Lapillicoccus sp.]